MSALHEIPLLPTADPADHAVAETAAGLREYACLVRVTHLGDRVRRLRAIHGVIRVIVDAPGAEVHIVVPAATMRQARRACVDAVAAAVPAAVVTVPCVVDYDEALTTHLHAGDPADWDNDIRWLDEAEVIAEVLDRH